MAALLTPADVHIDQPLTNLTLAWMQDQSNFVADQVFPRVPVSNSTNKYYKYDRAEFNRTGQVKVLAPGTETEDIGMSVSSDSYSIVPRGVGMTFSDQVLANEDTMLDTRAAGAQVLMSQLLIDREKEWASTYFATSVWDTEYTGVANASNNTTSEVTQWDDYTNSTPIVDVTTAMRAASLASGGFKPNVMVVTRDVRDTLINHPDILDRLNGGATVTNTALVTDAKLAEIFGVSKFLIMDGIQNDTNEGATESLSFIATKKAALYYAATNAGLMTPSAGYIFTWADYDRATGHGISIRSYTGDFLSIKGITEKIEGVMAYDHKVVASEMGVFFNTIIS